MYGLSFITSAFLHLTAVKLEGNCAGWLGATWVGRGDWLLLVRVIVEVVEFERFLWYPGHHNVGWMSSVGSNDSSIVMSPAV